MQKDQLTSNTRFNQGTLSLILGSITLFLTWLMLLPGYITMFPEFLIFTFVFNISYTFVNSLLFLIFNFILSIIVVALGMTGLKYSPKWQSILGLIFGIISLLCMGLYLFIFLIAKGTIVL